MRRHYNKTIILLMTLAIIACAWWAFEGYQFVSKILTEQKVSLGDWGDSFGGILAIFSGLAFIGTLGAIALQRDLISNQITDTGKAEFERTYFQLLQMLREQRSALVYISPTTSTNKSTSTGLKAARAAYLATGRSLGKYSTPIDAQRLAEKYTSIVHDRHESVFGAYFRTLYVILRKIDNNKYLSSDDKIEYSRILRAQMTSYETAILGLNGLAIYSKDLKNYIETYRMLKYSKEGEIRKHLEGVYPKTAFSGRR